MGNFDGDARIAAITMVWNEHLFLPLWLDYYGRQLGRENLFVVDNDSDDGSTISLGAASRLRYPRVPFDDAGRATFISRLANTIRANYDVVIVTDCDEFLVPDPALYSGLKHYVAETPGVALASIGLNVNQILTEENPFDTGRTLFSQRRHVQFVSPMCKPAITRADVAYSPGFHNSNLKPTFGRLFNFHLRWVDCGHALRRLAATRQMAWLNTAGWHYQRQPDEDALNHFLYIAKLKRNEDEAFEFEPQVGHLHDRIASAGDAGPFVIAQDIRDQYITVLPSRFDSSIL